jgi:hypothetical protein
VKFFWNSEKFRDMQGHLVNNGECREYRGSHMNIGEYKVIKENIGETRENRGIQGNNKGKV